MYIEVAFTLLMVISPAFIFLFRRFTPMFFLALIGANPYVSAGVLLSSLALNIQLICRTRIDKHLFILFFLWFICGIAISIRSFSWTFVAELIQLIIAILLAIYLYQFINTERRLRQVISHLMLSGLVLAIFEIFLFITGSTSNTLSFIGANSENYTSFYLVITSVAIPLCLVKKNPAYAVLIVLGFMAIFINESRAMMLLGALLIGFEFIRLKNLIFRFFAILTAFLGLIVLFITFDPNSIYSPDSVFSILNFENNFSNLERLSLLLHSYDLFLSNPSGYGIGSSFSLFFNNGVTVNQHYPHPHNTLAFLAVELGIVGIIIYLYFIYNLIIPYFKAHQTFLKKLCFNLSLSTLLFSVADVLFYNGVLTLVTFSILSIVVATKRLNVKTKN